MSSKTTGIDAPDAAPLLRSRPDDASRLSGDSSSASVIKPLPAIEWYYQSLETRLGYRLVLGGAKHFAYWDEGTFWPTGLGAALVRMEDRFRAGIGFDTDGSCRGKTVLDLGCGETPVGRHIARTTGCEVQGLDFTPAHIEKARRKVAREVKRGSLRSGQVSVFPGDYHDLFAPGTGVERGQFDAICASETIAHALDTPKVFKNLYDALKPGGKLCIHDYCLAARSAEEAEQWNAAEKAKLEDWRWVNKMAGMTSNDRSYLGTYDRMLEEVGFVNVKAVKLNENIKPMARLFFWLAFVPYWFVILLGLEKPFLNTVTGYKLWKNWGMWNYMEWTAIKPLDAA